MKKHYIRLKFKEPVALHFRKYAKTLQLNNSVCLDLMLNFFEHNNLSPTENIGPKMQTLESAIKKRINALIAIVREIEQQQTLPTKGMLDALFEGLPAQTKKKIIPSLEQAFQNMETGQTLLPKSSPVPDHQDIRAILNQIERVNPRFGKAYWKLSMDDATIEKLKTKYHVYHD